MKVTAVVQKISAEDKCLSSKQRLKQNAGLDNMHQENEELDVSHIVNITCCIQNHLQVSENIAH